MTDCRDRQAPGKCLGPSIAWGLSALAILVVAAGCLADDAAQGAAADFGVETQEPRDGGQASSGDARVDAILDRLEVKGRAIKGLKCKLTYRYVTVVPVESVQVKEGELLYSHGEPNSQFLVHFNRLIADGVVQQTGEFFAFDGRWVTERNDKTKKVVRKEIVREGERMDAFKLGKGPFILPFGQRREDILRNFRVKMADFTLGDPRGSDHLNCVPLPNTELAEKYTRVEIFVDRRLELPVRIVTERISDGNRIEVDFKEIDTQEAPAGSRFRVEAPAGFEVVVEPLPARTSPAAGLGGDKE